MIKNLTKKQDANERFDVKKSKDFFNSLGEDYINSAKTEYALIYNRTASIIRPYLRGKVLNLGSGGIDLPKAESVSSHVSVDTSEELLKYHRLEEGREAVCAEARNLPFEEEMFDVVVAHFSLHHFAQKSVKLTYKYLREVFESINKVVKRKGKVIIAENTFNETFAFLERLSYPMLRWLLDISKRPPVYLFSKKTLNKFLYSTGFKLLYSTSFKETSKSLIMPFSIPRSINPISISVLVGEKQ